MENLNVKELLELIDKAVKLNLSQDFISLVFNELIERLNTELDTGSMAS